VPTVLQFGCGQCFDSVALTGVSKCKKVLSAGIITVYTVIPHSVSVTYPLLFPCVHKITEVGECFKPFSVGGGTTFPCVLLHFNHWLSHCICHHSHDVCTPASFQPMSALRPRVKRVCLKDVLFLLEQERSSSKSTLLYKAFMKSWRERQCLHTLVGVAAFSENPDRLGNSGMEKSGRMLWGVHRHPRRRRMRHGNPREEGQKLPFCFKGKWVR